MLIINNLKSKINPKNNVENKKKIKHVHPKKNNKP